MTSTRPEISTALPRKFRNRPELADATTSTELKTLPRHQWFYFPHSFSSKLVNEILDTWEFPKNGTVVDNFVGSGTTILAARERGLKAIGCDLSPLAVLVSETKSHPYNAKYILHTSKSILKSPTITQNKVPERLSKAFTKKELGEIFGLLSKIRDLQAPTSNFFLVALLWTAKQFSRAVPDGGWFRWKDWPDRSEKFREIFRQTVTYMIDDIKILNWNRETPKVQTCIADARILPIQTGSANGVITSPPYPNRHDYSRVFHIELLLMGFREPEITTLRHQSIRSHVEATPPDNTQKLQEYREPRPLQKIINELPTDIDQRVKRLIEGYFQDIYLSLTEVSRILEPGGRAAYVIGNVRHAGVMIPVDEIISHLAEQAGLKFEEAWVSRIRGNSAQQMGQFGKQPSRESVILMLKETANG